MAETLLASAGDDIKLWECSGFTQCRQLAPHSGNISCLDWSHDNNVLASASTGGDKIVLTYLNAAAYSYSLATGEGKSCLSFNLSSRYLVGGGTDNLISIWDLKTQKLKRTYKGHQGPITCAQFNWNDTVVASGSENGEVILHNVVTGVGCSPLIATKAQAVRHLRYSHFKKSLLGSVSDDGAVNLWDTNTRRLVHGFTDSHKAPAMDLAFSPLNEMLLLSVGLDKRIVCFDVQGKNPVKTMMAEAPLTSISIMHNGTTLAVGSTRGKIYVYDLRQGATPIRTMTAHRSSVRCLAFQQKTKTNKSSPGPSHSKTTTANSRKTTSSNTSNNNSGNSTNHNLNRNGVTNTTSELGVVNGKDGIEKPRASPSTHSEPFRVRDSELEDKADIFSPLRERLLKKLGYHSYSRSYTAVTPQQSRSAEMVVDGRPETTGRHSGIDSQAYADGVFSPLADNFHSTSADRGRPVGGAAPQMSPLTYNQLVTTNNTPHQWSSKDTDANQNRPSTEEHMEYRVYQRRDGSPSGSTSPSSVTSSRDDTSGEHPAQFPNTRPQRMLPELPSSDYAQYTNYSHPPGNDYVHSTNFPPQSFSSDYSSHPTRSSQSSAAAMEQEFPTTSSEPVLHSHPELPQLTVTSPQSTTSGHSPLPQLPTPTEATSSMLEGATAFASDDSRNLAQIRDFQQQMVRSLVTEELQEFREQVRQDMLNLHMDVLKQFQLQQAEMQSMLQRFSVNEDLITEIERLKEENKQLRKKF